MDNSVGKKKAKILLFGLENSGKTSILLSLQSDINILSYYKLHPTKGVGIKEYETDNYQMNIWDFGGQEQYRINYLKNFNKYSYQASKLIYVIDIQDVGKYESAINYFQEIINKCIEENLEISISIYLHKYDPNLENQEKFKKINEMKPQLIEQLKQIIPSKFTYDISKSTIYTTFKKTLINL